MSQTTAEHSRPAGLDERAIGIQRSAREFVEGVLIPLEEEAERLHGRLPEETVQRVKSEASAAGLTGGLHSSKYGGQEWSTVE